MRRHDAAVKLALRGFLLQLGIKSAGYQPTIYRKSGQTVTFKVKGQQVQYTAPVGGNYQLMETLLVSLVGWMLVIGMTISTIILALQSG